MYYSFSSQSIGVDMGDKNEGKCVTNDISPGHDIILRVQTFTEIIFYSRMDAGRSKPTSNPVRFFMFEFLSRLVGHVCSFRDNNVNADLLCMYGWIAEMHAYLCGGQV